MTARGTQNRWRRDRTWRRSTSSMRAFAVAMFMGVALAGCSTSESDGSAAGNRSSVSNGGSVDNPGSAIGGTTATTTAARGGGVAEPEVAAIAENVGKRPFIADPETVEKAGYVERRSGRTPPDVSTLLQPAGMAPSSERQDAQRFT